MTTENQPYGTRHDATCPSGDRAEVRGPCTCGAQDGRPWRLRIERSYAPGERPTVHVITDRALTMREAVELALTLQELTRVEGERWARAQLRAMPPRDQITKDTTR